MMICIHRYFCTNEGCQTTTFSFESMSELTRTKIALLFLFTPDEQWRYYTDK